MGFCTDYERRLPSEQHQGKVAGQGGSLPSWEEEYETAVVRTNHDVLWKSGRTGK
jgi:hypothetical protein